MNYDIGEPHQSELLQAVAQREAATSARGKSRANAAIRSIRLRAARSKGTHTQKQWAHLVDCLNGRCAKCGVYGSSVALQKDHVTPIYQGGSDGIDNLQPLCGPCNAAKGPEAFNWAAYRLQQGFDE